MSRDTYNWGSSRRKYEWKEEYTQQGFAPRDEALEKELFGEENHVHSGLNFNKYDSIPVKVTGENPPPGFDKVNPTKRSLFSTLNSLSVLYV